jgi:hypothetical protein
LLESQNLDSKDVTSKIFQNKELEDLPWTNAISTLVARFARIKPVCAFRFGRVKVVRHNDSDGGCGKGNDRAKRPVGVYRSMSDFGYYAS